MAILRDFFFIPQNLSQELESKCAQLEVLKDLHESSSNSATTTTTKGCENKAKNFSDHNKVRK